MQEHNHHHHVPACGKKEAEDKTNIWGESSALVEKECFFLFVCKNTTRCSCKLLNKLHPSPIHILWRGAKCMRQEKEEEEGEMRRERGLCFNDLRQWLIRSFPSHRWGLWRRTRWKRHGPGKAVQRWPRQCHTGCPLSVTNRPTIKSWEKWVQKGEWRGQMLGKHDFLNLINKKSLSTGTRHAISTRFPVSEIRFFLVIELRSVSQP